MSTDPLSGYNPAMEVEHYIDGQHNGGVFNSFNHNTYGYCYQNPVRLIDPNGKQTEGDTQGKLSFVGPGLAPVVTTGTATATETAVVAIASSIGTAILTVGALLIPATLNAPAPKNQPLPERFKPKTDDGVEKFYRAMSNQEYASTLGYLNQKTDQKGNYRGEGPFVTPRLDYAQKALNDFGNSKKYDLIVEYTVVKGTKDMLNTISIPHGPGISGESAGAMGLPIKKVESVNSKVDKVTNYSFYGSSTVIFNSTLISPPKPIEYKNN